MIDSAPDAASACDARSISSSTAAGTPSASTMSSAEAPGATGRPTNASTDRSESPSMSSTAAGITPETHQRGHPIDRPADVGERG